MKFKGEVVYTTLYLHHVAMNLFGTFLNVLSVLLRNFNPSSRLESGADTLTLIKLLPPLAPVEKYGC